MKSRRDASKRGVVRGRMPTIQATVSKPLDKAAGSEAMRDKAYPIPPGIAHGTKVKGATGAGIAEAASGNGESLAPSPNEEHPAQASSEVLLMLNVGALLQEQSFTFTDMDGTDWTWAVSQARTFAEQAREVAWFTYADYGLTKEAVEKQYPTLDKEYALTTDLSKPLLLILFKDELLCIDGWHRLWRAIHEGVERLPTYLLLSDEADQFLLSCVPPGGPIRWGPVIAGRIFQIETEPPTEIAFSPEVMLTGANTASGSSPSRGGYSCSACGERGMGNNN